MPKIVTWKHVDRLKLKYCQPQVGLDMLVTENLTNPKVMLIFFPRGTVGWPIPEVVEKLVNSNLGKKDLGIFSVELAMSEINTLSDMFSRAQKV